jgi:predicted transcriptional regulator
MQTAKQSLEAMIRTLPEDASFEDIKYRINLVAKLHERLDSVDAGEVISHDEAKKRMAKWLTD